MNIKNWNNPNPKYEGSFRSILEELRAIEKQIIEISSEIDSLPKNSVAFKYLSKALTELKSSREDIYNYEVYKKPIITIKEPTTYF